MTTAALLQSTSVLTDFVAEATFRMDGNTGGQFVAQATDIIVATYLMAGSSDTLFLTDAHQLAPAALQSAGVGTATFVGVADVGFGVASSVLLANGFSTVQFVGVNAGVPPPEQALPVRFISGPESGVIPVEIVDAPGPDVVEVRLFPGENYTPIFIDPTNPMRKKIHFVEEP